MITVITKVAIYTVGFRNFSKALTTRIRTAFIFVYVYSAEMFAFIDAFITLYCMLAT